MQLTNEIHEGSAAEDKGGSRETGNGGERGGRKIRAPRTEAMVFEGRANGPLIDRKEDARRREKKKEKGRNLT